MRIEQGADQLTVYSDTSTDSGHPMERHFCKICGSNVYMRPTAPIATSKGIRIVNFGTLDDATDWVPQKQMYPEQQASFVKQLDIRPRENKL
ncbi:hypothetical protein NLJ89_g5105 [Agrocybe chaxingu]|uniref:CENP-V/GFA domain-containing protein n=1 Tax=Agrocybe chaxingu TaxID=84603 RepID=A0A9W8K197_9AGAR|nr:hypothetical protein NLJ89_g5105 [Agrocybe chaxingu]